MLWFNAAVTPQFSWVNIAIALPFENETFVLSPPTDTLACCVALFDSKLTTFEELGTSLSRFLSRLAWSMNGGIVEFSHVGTNIPNKPGRLRQGTYARSGWATVDPPHSIYLPSVTSPDADLALALYREGLSVNSVPFGFLSLFKILNIRNASGPAQVEWINNNLHHIWYPPAVDRIREIQVANQNVGNYMYVQGRCAVAHAHSTPLINPDNDADRRRLNADFPLMKELAAHYIESELGVLSTSTFHKRFIPEINGKDALMKGPVLNGWLSYVPFQQGTY